MDKREFYKQLMENYTIDTEKVKCNAKRRYRNQSTGRLHKWTVGIAACTAVAAVAAITVVSINSLPNRSGVDITDSSIESAMERLRAADQRYLALSAEQETMDIYVSFSKDLSRNEILMAFSALEDFSDIKISYLYMEKGKRYENSENTDGSLQFRGAKITAPTHLYNDLKELKAIAYLEPVEGSEYNDDTFVPIVIPPEVMNNTVSTDQTFEIPLPENTLPPETVDTSSGEVTAEPETEDSVTSEVPASETVETSSGGTFPVENIVLIPVSNVTYAEFINENQIVVTAEDSIRLCRLKENDEVQLETTFYANNAKVNWSNSNNSKLFITACDDKGRNKMFFADGESGILSEIDVSALTAGGYEISSVICNESSTAMLIKTVSLDKSRIYYASRNGNAMQVVLSKEFGCPVSVLCCSERSIYALVTDPTDSSMSIMEVSVADGNSVQIAHFGGNVKYVRNASLDMANITVVGENGVESYMLTNNGVLIPLEGHDPIFSSSDGMAFKLGPKYYVVIGDTAIELSEEDAEPYFNDDTADNKASKHTTKIDREGAAFVLINRDQ